MQVIQGASQLIRRRGCLDTTIRLSIFVSNFIDIHIFSVANWGSGGSADVVNIQVRDDQYLNRLRVGMIEWLLWRQDANS